MPPCRPGCSRAVSRRLSSHYTAIRRGESPRVEPYCGSAVPVLDFTVATSDPLMEPDTTTSSWKFPVPVHIAEENSLGTLLRWLRSRSRRQGRA